MTKAQAERRRSAHLKQSPIPKGVRLSAPWWLRLSGTEAVIHYAALLAALLAPWFPGVGVGILSVAVASTCFFFFSPLLRGP